MDRDDLMDGTGLRTDRRQACLVAGCTCKDARIVSGRRARFFADLAQAKGETASRVIRPEPGWTLPTSV
jgi:hypothetical protein